ncbi:DUF1697 domain-containing protein [Fuscibacter oryzae]|uniref:DUF1697 domain-containing protein n=1 Tax=Fuscibacter oryzae TaxID=2803939 RepID=A0A8J7MSV1_9RHOB|nr:DUF1697 domain-containing protein [Fuscibacter oryzae]MBL4929982.1 DUF1697 domain-containing protein [Fuscibacter oryzae]
MTRRILLLRGVNVGGANRLPMADFRGLLASLGLGNPRTLIASGNAVFDDPGLPNLSGKIAKAIAARFGFAPDLFLYTAETFAAIIAANPYAAEAAADGAKVHAFFLATPTQLDEAKVKALATTERLHLTSAALYLHAPDGLGRSKLAERLPRLLATPSTARNWNTVESLAALAAA